VASDPVRSRLADLVGGFVSGVLGRGAMSDWSLKPSAGTFDLIDVVWCSPIAWETDAARRQLVASLIEGQDIRLIYCCPGQAPSEGNRWPSRRWRLVVPDGHTDTLHLLRVDAPDRLGRRIAEAGAIRRFLRTLGAFGIRDPILVNESGLLDYVARVTGWISIALGDSQIAVPVDPAVLRQDIQSSVEHRGRDEERLSVVVLDHCARLSGGELAMSRMLPACTGLDVRVVLAENGPLVDRLTADGLDVSVRPMDEMTHSVAKDAVVPGTAMVRAMIGAVRYSASLAADVRRERTDVVVTNSLKSALYGGVAGRLARVPVVWHLRDRISDDYLPRPAVLLVRLAARILPSGVIANSQSTLSTLRLSRRARERLFARSVGSPCVSAGETAPRHTEGDQGVVVGMVGRLTPWKGQDVFLRAFAAAFPDGGAKGKIVGAALFGEAEFEAELRALASELGIADRVEFVGHSDGVAREMADMDIVVHSSVVPEPFGQVVVEAMAAGCAVIASDGGGPAEVITDDVDGLLVPMGDCEALRRALCRLAADPVLRRRLGAAAVSGAMRFTPERVAEEVEATYRLVASAHRTGSAHFKTGH